MNKLTSNQRYFLSMLLSEVRDLNEADAINYMAEAAYSYGIGKFETDSKHIAATFYNKH